MRLFIDCLTPCFLLILEVFFFFLVMFGLNSFPGEEKKKLLSLFHTLIYVDVREGLAAIAASGRLL